MNDTNAYTLVPGGILAPRGFRAAAVASGIKKPGKLDVCLIVAEERVPAAAVFTRNSMAAPPVTLSREHVDDGYVRAVVTNSGNANACTGPGGLDDARAMAQAVGAAIGCQPADVVVASTGVIGVPLPMDSVLSGIEAAVGSLDAGTGDDAARAIMTTDTFAKQLAVQIDVDGSTYTVGGMAKGSGMIMPNMATMLAYVTTDAPLTPAACAITLRSATDATFNRITVDSDTSTNDMCVLMASGCAGSSVIDTQHEAFPALASAIEHVCGELARMIVRDGEGATKFIEVIVRGASSDADARDAAMSVANSPLFKTAVFGGDANWGRVVMALGKSGARVEPDKVEVVFAGITTCQHGTGVAFDETAASRALAEDEIQVVVDLHTGNGESTVWTCDLSYEYVRINGEYRT